MPARILKLMFSGVVWVWDCACHLVMSGLGLRARPGRCVVLYYHSVPTRFRDAFARQMDMLLKVARPISPVSRVCFDPGRRYAAVTFDDGFVSFATNALPELISRQIPSTIFVPAGCLGEEPGWESRQDTSWQGERVMTAKELASVMVSPWVTAGSHGLRHRDMTALSEEELRLELAGSKQRLEEVIGAPVSTLSFPYGSFGARETRFAAEAGYEFFFCSQQAELRGELGPGLVGRCNAQPSDWGIEFKLKLKGAYRWIAGASRVKQRIKRLAQGDAAKDRRHE